MYQTYSLTTPTGAVDIAVVSSSRAHLSSLIGMPLLVKAVTPEGTFVVISRVVPLAVQTLESVRTRCTIIRRSSHLDGSPQNGLGDERTCGTTLASACVLHCLSAVWSQLQMKERESEWG